MATWARARSGIEGRIVALGAIAAAGIACQAVSGLDELHGKTTGGAATTTTTTTTTTSGTTTTTGAGGGDTTGTGSGGATTTSTGAGGATTTGAGGHGGGGGTTTTGAGGAPPECNQPDPGTCTQAQGQCALQCTGATCAGVCSQASHVGGCSDPQGNVSCGGPDTLSASCSIDCPDSWCAAKHVICAKNHPCTIHCGAGACIGSTIECPSSKQPCSITCELGGCDASTKVMRGGGTLTATCQGNATIQVTGPASTCPALVDSCQ